MEQCQTEVYRYTTWVQGPAPELCGTWMEEEDDLAGPAGDYDMSSAKLVSIRYVFYD